MSLKSNRLMITCCSLSCMSLLIGDGIGGVGDGDGDGEADGDGDAEAGGEAGAPLGVFLSRLPNASLTDAGVALDHTIRPYDLEHNASNYEVVA